MKTILLLSVLLFSTGLFAQTPAPAPAPNDLNKALDNITNVNTTVSPVQANAALAAAQAQQTGPWYRSVSGLIRPAVMTAWAFARFLLPAIATLLLTFSVLGQIRRGDFKVMPLFYRALIFVVVFGGADIFFKELRTIKTALPAALFASVTEYPDWQAQAKTRFLFDEVRKETIQEVVTLAAQQKISWVDARPVAVKDTKGSTTNPAPSGWNAYYVDAATKDVEYVDVANDLLYLGSTNADKSIGTVDVDRKILDWRKGRESTGNNASGNLHRPSLSRLYSTPVGQLAGLDVAPKDFKRKEIVEGQTQVIRLRDGLDDTLRFLTYALDDDKKIAIATLLKTRIKEITGASANPASDDDFRSVVKSIYLQEIASLGVLPQSLTGVISSGEKTGKISLVEGNLIGSRINKRDDSNKDAVTFLPNIISVGVNNEVAKSVKDTLPGAAVSASSGSKWSIVSALKSFTLEIIGQVNTWVNKIALTIFSIVYNILFEIQFFLVMFSLPLLFSDELEKVFKAQLKQLGRIVVIPGIAALALGFFQVFMGSLIAGSLTGLIGGTSIVMMIPGGQSLAFGLMMFVFLGNIIGTILICLKIGSWTDKFMSGASIAGDLLKTGATAVIGGALAGANIGLGLKSVFGGGAGASGASTATTASTAGSATANAGTTTASVGSSSSVPAKLPSPAKVSADSASTSSGASADTANDASVLGRTPRPAKASANTTPSGQNVESTPEQKREAFLGDKMPDLNDPAPASGPASAEPASPPSKQSIAASLFNRTAPKRSVGKIGAFVRGNGGDRTPVAKQLAELYKHTSSTIDIMGGNWGTLRKSLDQHVDKHTKEEAERN